MLCYIFGLLSSLFSKCDMEQDVRTRIKVMCMLYNLTAEIGPIVLGLHSDL